MNTPCAFKSIKGKNEVLCFYDSLLDQWTVPYERLTIQTRYGNTFIIAAGEKNAPALILLHGSGMNSVMWLNDIRKYSRHYRVYAIDIPGEPGKSNEKQLPLNGTFHAQWLHDILDTLSIETACLIGISLGAWVAIKFSVMYPEKVDKLGLLGPAGIGPQKISFLFIAAFHMLLGEKGRKKLYSKINGNQPIPEVMVKYQMLIEKNFNYRREPIPMFSDRELKNLTMPVILFVGEKDIMLHSSRTAKRLGDLLPRANINVLPEAGHALVNLTDRIIPFLK